MFFWSRIRFWLRVFLILVESVPNFFFLRVSKYFFLIIIYKIFFFSGQAFPGIPWPERGAATANKRISRQPTQ